MKPLKDEIQQTKPFAGIEEEVYLNLLKTSDALRSEVDKTLSVMGLNHNQYNVLRILRGAESAGLETEEICQRMVTKETDFTGLVNKLEQRGLISLTDSQQFPSRKIGKITNQGLDVLTVLDVPIRQKLINLFNFLGNDLLEQFNTLLVLSRKNIKNE